MQTDTTLPRAAELVAELDTLAAISSLEGYYAADLPALHAAALQLAHKPDDRTGRYAALRDALGKSFDAIDDESFSYAARALLGYGDRWRSVRARSEDAGRAFTPSVSYDAFRRKGGRNYRENTLRAVADALIALLEEQAAPATTASHAADAAPATPAPPADEPRTKPGWKPPRVPALVVAGAVAIALGIALAVTAPWSADAALQEIDITRQCRAQHVDEPVIIATRLAEADGGWICLNPKTGEQTTPLMGQACADQYGPNALANYNDGWTCDVPSEHLHIPAAATRANDCDFVAGTYDQAATELNRYASRFVEAFAAADLPDGACTSGPMHYSGELPAGGVTQLLTLDGEQFGAVVADDPANVVVLTGNLWWAYKAVRGLQLYQLEMDILEDRVGYPAGPLRQQQGIYRLDLTSGGALIGQTETGSFVWMPSVSLLVWEKTGGPAGCLGMPVSSPPTDRDGPIAQQFERAVLSFDLETAQFIFSPPEACDS